MRQLTQEKTARGISRLALIFLGRRSFWAWSSFFTQRSRIGRQRWRARADRPDIGKPVAFPDTRLGPLAGKPRRRGRMPRRFRFSECARLRFVMVSRLSKEKGYNISISAFSRVAIFNPKARLDVFGDGPERESLERLVKKLRLNWAWPRSCHGTTFSSRHSRIKEGSPVSIVEAMACTLPVIATAIGGIASQVVPGRTGYLVSEGDVAGMSVAMQRLASDPALRKQLGSAARTQAVAYHDSTTKARRLGELSVRRSATAWLPMSGGASLGQRNGGGSTSNGIYGYRTNLHCNIRGVENGITVLEPALIQDN